MLDNVILKGGSILIAEPFSVDKYFERSVVLLIDYHERYGGMGFILNKRIKDKLNDFFPEMKDIDDIPVFGGGPLGSNKLYFIHTLGDIVSGAYKILDGLYFGGDFGIIKSYITSGNPVEGKIKFFLGYSGWERRQLEEEIAQRSWLVGKGEQAKIMKSEGEILWKKALHDLGSQYKSWANFPRRPFLN